MARLQLFAGLALMGSVSAWISGCTTSSPPAPPSNTSQAKQTTQPEAQDPFIAATKSDATTDMPKEDHPGASGDTTPGQVAIAETTKPSEAAVNNAKPGFWEDYPDVPKAEIMREVDGIKIPRQKVKTQSLQLTGKLPADVGNAHAAKNPSTPVTGDTVTIRFNSEPKVLNNITESSAVQTYIGQYIQEGLARQNPETFEYEPFIASKWVAEDSIKLSPDYPGHERRIALSGGERSTTLEIEYTATGADGKKDKEPPRISLRTSDRDGQPIGNVWVGVYPIGKIVGAAETGIHFWSDHDGHAEISGIPSGKYTVKVGAEIYGKAKRNDDGSLVVTPETPENPLHEMLKSAADPFLNLKAGDWTELHQQTYYTYYLRDDVKWSDGTPFTTKDIEFGYALLNSQYVDGDSIRTYYQDLLECRSFGPHVVRMRYRQQYFKAFEFTYGITAYSPPFHFFAKIFQDQGRELTLQKLTPEQETAQKKISAHGQEFGKFFNTDDRYNRAPLGTGPYIVDKWISKDRVELVRNENYWNPPFAGHLDRIIVKFIPDQVSALAALKAGEIDFLYRMTPEQYFEDWPNLDLARKDDYVLASWYTPAFSYYGWNFLAPQLQDRRVRIALALLLDRQDFLATKMHGAGVLVSGPEYYFGQGYDHQVEPLAYDPETARDLLAAAGWIDTDNDGILDRDGQKFEVTLVLPQGQPIIVQRCEVFQKNLKSVGINLKIQDLEWASFIDKVKAKQCDVITLSWAMAPENDPFQIWHSSGAGRDSRGSNSIAFANPQVDSLIEMLRVTLDPKKRQKIEWSFHRTIDSEQPYMFLWIPKEFGAYHKRFRNVKWYRLRPGFDLSEWYVPKNEQLH